VAASHSTLNELHLSTPYQATDGAKMADHLTQEEIARVGRVIISDIAPQELLLFRMQSEAFFQNGARALAAPKVGEDALGFGAGELAGLATPIVLMGDKTVVTCVAQDLGRELGAHARAGARQLIQRLFGPSETDCIALTNERLERIRAAVMANAGQDAATAQRVADAIVATLQMRREKSTAAD
jgi:hypothetical protein